MSYLFILFFFPWDHSLADFLDFSNSLTTSSNSDSFIDLLSNHLKYMIRLINIIKYKISADITKKIKQGLVIVKSRFMVV